MTSITGTNDPAQQLPSPPPSVRKPTIWDKDHISQTLLGIGQAFLSNQDFGAGLGAAAGSMSDRMKTLQAENTKAVALGGPDNAFEVVTDTRTGQRTYRPVEAFQTYAADKYNREHRPSLAEGRKATSAAMSAVLALPPERQPAAAAALKAKLAGQGYDVGHLPDAENYSAMAATLARDMGVDTVVQENRDRNAKRDAATADYRDRSLGLRSESIGIAKQREARAGLPKAPPKSVRSKLPTGFILD